MKSGVLLTLALLLALPTVSVGEVVLRTASGGRVKTLDPAMADDLDSRNLAGAIFDTLLEYDYVRRPYMLRPSMLAEMPGHDAEWREFTFTLRDDLYFSDVPELPLPREKRRITSKDVAYSILRIADARLHSPMFWMFRSRIEGIDEFHRLTARLPRNDNSPYDRGISGIRIADDRHFTIRLCSPGPRFLYLLAMPNVGIVPRYAVEHFGIDFARHPVGSGPFVLKHWTQEYRLTLERNAGYREEYFKDAENPADRSRRLPLVDKVEIFQIKQPMTAYLLFLQGNLDYHELDKANADLVAGGRMSPALAELGVRLVVAPECTINYIGFNFRNPMLANNIALRRALSMSYDVDRRVRLFDGQLLPQSGPIPPGIAGYDEKMANPWSSANMSGAAEQMRLAGFPLGMDPSTNQGIELSFDQSGNSSLHRQIGELAVADFRRIGIGARSVLNNNPRFYEKLRKGTFDLFRLSWTADYPDAENFLQLFYSGNIGGCNRTGFSDARYDAMYEKMVLMPDGVERTELCRTMGEYLVDKCVWIYEGIPVGWTMSHQWIQNYRPSDFSFSKFKYLGVDAARRESLRATFRPLGMAELSAK